MSILPRRFEIPSAVAYKVAAAARGLATARGGVVARVRRDLETAARTARRTGTIAAPLLGLRLDVYRIGLHGRPHDMIVRATPTGDRVVGVVPTPRSPRGRARSSVVMAAVLGEQEATELAFEILAAETEDEVDEFLGKVFKKIGKAAQSVASGVRSVGNSIGKVIDKVNKIVPIKSVIQSVSKGLDSVNKFVPIGSLMSLTPMGLTIRAAKGLGRVASGENIFKVAGGMVKSGLKDVGQVMQAASTVASFVPGLGTGVGAALGAASALAQGQPITEAVLAAAKGAVPGGAIAAAAFDVARGLAQGKNLTEAALTAARNQLPGGPAARAAFDTGLALARGQKLQDAALGVASKLAPASPLGRTALAVARQAAS